MIITCLACGNKKQATDSYLMPWHVNTAAALAGRFTWCDNFDPTTTPPFIEAQPMTGKG